MSISVGDRIPSTTVSMMSSGEPEEISTDKLFANKKNELSPTYLQVDTSIIFSVFIPKQN